MSETTRRWQRLYEQPDLVAAAADVAPGEELAVQGRLRDRYDDDLVPLAFQLAEVRRKAVGRFERASQLWADRVALEQATSEAIARHKATRFAAAGGLVYDLCSGLGSDSIAMAERSPVIAVDLREEASHFVRWNAEAYGVEVDARIGDATTLDPVWTDSLVHIDPDRRVAGRRVRRIEEYQPGLDFLQTVARGRGGAIKVSPASNFGGKFPETEAELVAIDRECREATIWYGELAGEAAARATVITDAGVATLGGNPLDSWTTTGPVGNYLLDPNPALVRSGLVDLFAERTGCHRLDDAEEYLSAESSLADSAWLPFVTSYRILALDRAKPKEIRRLLKLCEATHVEVKVRHVAVDANALERKFSQPSAGSHRRVTLFYARVAGKTTAIVTERVGDDRG